MLRHAAACFKTPMCSSKKRVLRHAAACCGCTCLQPTPYRGSYVAFGLRLVTAFHCRNLGCRRLCGSNTCSAMEFSVSVLRREAPLCTCGLARTARIVGVHVQCKWRGWCNISHHVPCNVSNFCNTCGLNTPEDSIREVSQSAKMHSVRRPFHQVSAVSRPSKPLQAVC